MSAPIIKYISIDLQKHQYSQYRVQKNNDVPHGDSVFELDNKFVVLKKHQSQKTNALHEELLSFINSIQNSQKIAVSGYDGMRAIEVALLIQQKINE